jgi:hypothetical protein
MKIKRKRPENLPTPTTSVKMRKKPYQKSFAVKHLEAMANDAVRRKYPNTPPDWLVPRKYRDDSANGLTKCIIDFLKFEGHHAKLIETLGRLIDTRQTFTDVIGRSRTIGSTKWIKRNGRNGTADISATIKGFSVKIEVKHGRDRQSDVQRVYQCQVQQAGGLYIITKTFEQFYNWYNQKFCSDER